MATLPGRGTGDQPKNRFERTEYVADETLEGVTRAEDLPRRVALTEFIVDSSRSILAHNDSPDVPFTYSINPYRGCEHGCAYCFARPTHEYLGYSAGLDFETKILVKHDAPVLLRAALRDAKWVPETVTMSGVTDCYQPVERKLKITRGCLEVFAEFRNPVCIVTKNHLVTRDIDVLAKLAACSAVQVMVSVTTLDAGLTRILEPRTSVPQDRLRAIGELAAAGIQVGVMVAPVIPGLTDHEMMAILAAAREAGAVTAGFVPLRLPLAVKDIFAQWLADHLPDRRDKVLHRIEAVRGGKLNDCRFGERMKGSGIFAEQFKAMFEMGKRKCGYPTELPKLSAEAFCRPMEAGDQLPLF